ncbi:Anaphase-promoting complex subunit 5 domain [Dillenia turbinata]|uniref:Anaphase-promoting complex subunit 5 n=1 Tax=Dillenia turbinata TaxID=194707 RepID=A0AAN8UJI9_9MAGN
MAGGGGGGGILKPSSGSFVLTPHKVSVCILLQIYAPPAQITVPFPFSSVSHHNSLGLFLFALTKSCDDILEPKLDELVSQLGEVGRQLSRWMTDHLTRGLSSLSTPDDLFNFFADLRGILGGIDSSAMEDDQIFLDPNSNLGLFVRRCLLAFNYLSFEGVCHLWKSIENYCKEAPSSCNPYALRHLEDSNNDSEALLEYENMDLENFVFEKVTEEIEARKRASGGISFHIHTPKELLRLVDDVELSAPSKPKNDDKGSQTCTSSQTPATLRGADAGGSGFLRTNWQIQGYLMEQADAIEKRGSSFPLNAFELVLKQLQKLAPELHRVHFLRHLNNLFHDDYPAALENLLRYFDYSAGMEGLEFVPPSPNSNNFGRYEIALLCLGLMQFHFGHPKQALEVLTEAVRVSQHHSDDTCLALTLAAICSLLSELGVSSTTGILGSSESSFTSTGASLSIQQQLFVLLRRSLRRAESLKLKRLMASNHLTRAKFDLRHVQRPLLSFGPKASMNLRTCPANVCKELRSCSHLICDFAIEGAIMTIDGALSTTWLQNLQKPTGSLVLHEEHGSRDDSDMFHFRVQESTIPGSVLQLVGSSYLLRSTAWEVYGSSSLARISALLYATCYADASSSADVALAYAKLIQHLALFQGYKDAFAALKIAEEKFQSISKSRIHLVKLQLLHEHALHRGHLKLAQQVCNELAVLASSVTGVDMDLKTEASLRHARTLLAAKQFSQAATVAHSLFCNCYKFNLQVENATVLLLLAEIHKKSGNAVLGLPYALASLSFCQSFNLDLLKASATLVLAELWLSMGSNHAKRALSLIHGALPMLLGQGGLELRARSRIAEAKCYLSDPDFSVYEEPELVLDALKQASEELQVLEYHELAAEAFYLLAIVYDKLRRLKEREDAAASFKQHIMALEHPQNDYPVF